LEAESPTSITSIPALSIIVDSVKSYAVSIEIFSPLDFISANVLVVIRVYFFGELDIFFINVVFFW
jgi:hypothetical protein